MPSQLANRRIRSGTQIRKELPTSRHIPYMRMVDHHTIKTREGEMMRVLLIEGWPFETSDDDKIDALKSLKNVVYRGIASPTTGIYTHIVRRQVDVDLPGEIEDVFGASLNKKYQDVLASRTLYRNCLLYTSPSPRDGLLSRMPSSA